MLAPEKEAVQPSTLLQSLRQEEEEKEAQILVCSVDITSALIVWYSSPRCVSSASHFVASICSSAAAAAAVFHDFYGCRSLARPPCFNENVAFSVLLEWMLDLPYFN